LAMFEATPRHRSGNTLGKDYVNPGSEKFCRPKDDAAATWACGRKPRSDHSVRWGSPRSSRKTVTMICALMPWARPGLVLVRLRFRPLDSPVCEGRGAKKKGKHLWRGLFARTLLQAFGVIFEACLGGGGLSAPERLRRATFWAFLKRLEHSSACG